jgi:hypothetical protein
VCFRGLWLCSSRAIASPLHLFSTLKFTHKLNISPWEKELNKRISLRQKTAENKTMGS